MEKLYSKIIKYKRIILSVSLLAFITLMGIFIYSKTEVLRALSSFAKVDSVHMEGTVSLFLDDYRLDLKGSANYSNHILSSDLTTDYIWNPISLELYATIEEERITFYLLNNLTDDCLNSTQKVSSISIKKDKFDIKKLSIKKVSSDKLGEKKYKIELPKKHFFSVIIGKELEIPESEKMIIYFYVRNGKITGIKAQDEIIYLSKEKNVYFSNFNVTFSSWNSVSDVSIPENKTEKCKEIDKNILKELFS